MEPFHAVAGRAGTARTVSSEQPTFNPIPGLKRQNARNQETPGSQLATGR
jgi:hypothetical protein